MVAGGWFRATPPNRDPEEGQSRTVSQSVLHSCCSIPSIPSTCRQVSRFVPQGHLAGDRSSGVDRRVGYLSFTSGAGHSVESWQQPQWDQVPVTWLATDGPWHAEPLGAGYLLFAMLSYGGHPSSRTWPLRKPSESHSSVVPAYRPGWLEADGARGEVEFAGFKRFW